MGLHVRHRNLGVYQGEYEGDRYWSDLQKLDLPFVRFPSAEDVYAFIGMMMQIGKEYGAFSAENFIIERAAELEDAA